MVRVPSKLGKIRERGTTGANWCTDDRPLHALIKGLLHGGAHVDHFLLVQVTIHGQGLDRGLTPRAQSSHTCDGVAAPYTRNDALHMRVDGCQVPLRCSKELFVKGALRHISRIELERKRVHARAVGPAFLHDDFAEQLMDVQCIEARPETICHVHPACLNQLPRLIGEVMCQ